MTDRKDNPAIQVIHVQSRFSRVARRAGGIAAADAIAAAEAFVEGERGHYFDWVAEDLAELEHILGRVHGSNGQDMAQTDAAYYKTAQIRDLGGTFGYQIITDVAHCFCELLYRLKMAGIYSADAIETHRAAIKLVCGRDFGQMPAGTGPTLLAGLQRVVDKFPAPSLPAPAAET